MLSIRGEKERACTDVGPRSLAYIGDREVICRVLMIKCGDSLCHDARMLCNASEESLGSSPFSELLSQNVYEAQADRWPLRMACRHFRPSSSTNEYSFGNCSSPSLLQCRLAGSRNEYYTTAASVLIDFGNRKIVHRLH